MPTDELADEEAKKGAAIPFQDPRPISLLSFPKQWNLIAVSQCSLQWWIKNTRSSYVKHEINPAPPFPRELLLNLKSLGYIIAVRTCLGHFATYHSRLKHQEAYLLYRCGSPLSPIHPLFCRIVRCRGGSKVFQYVYGV